MPAASNQLEPKVSVYSSRGKAWEETRTRVLERDGWTCTECGKHLQGADATVDHITPKSKGGTDDEWNLISLCRKHNAEKGDRTLMRRNYFNPRWLNHL
jgi:5-methylcytosine-specific restriction endonuclease McrA